MDLRLIYAILFTILPVTELRVGLPLGILFALENNIPVLLVFSTIILINILLIFFIFYFLDVLNKQLMKIKPYRKIFEGFLIRFQKKVDKFEKKYNSLGFLALVILVAIPLPGTGAWSGSLISWILGLDRKKSIVAISLGILIAGTLVFLGTVQFINYLKI